MSLLFRIHRVLGEDIYQNKVDKMDQHPFSRLYIMCFLPQRILVRSYLVIVFVGLNNYRAFLMERQAGCDDRWKRDSC